MSLNTVLVQLLNRSILNPGHVYRTTLERGLDVAFLTDDHTNKTTMQLSRPKPSEPSNQELTTCLEALSFPDPSTHTGPTLLQDTNRNYIQVSFAALRRWY